MRQATTLRGADFVEFADKVLDHIETYTVPQYGDKGHDQASEFKSHDHVVQAKKYLNRYGKNSRPGQEILDLIKTAHYCQMAAMELTREMNPDGADNCANHDPSLCVECYNCDDYKRKETYDANNV